MYFLGILLLLLVLGILYVTVKNELSVKQQPPDYGNRILIKMNVMVTVPLTVVIYIRNFV